MKIRRATSLAGLTACLASAVMTIGACSSVPKPAEADGSARVPANDPERVQALQQRVAQDRALLTENNLLKAQVDALQQKLNEVTTIVREALTLPPVPSMQRPQVAPAPSAPSTFPPSSANPPTSTVPPTRQPMALRDVPFTAYKATPGGLVIRVFYPFARTEFEPSEAVARALRLQVRNAEHIDVIGHTDSNVVNQRDRVIANLRAEKARIWLINNGAEPQKISTHWFSAGRFLTENVTPEGRSLNRRVEVDIRKRSFESWDAAVLQEDGNELASRLGQGSSL